MAPLKPYLRDRVSSKSSGTRYDIGVELTGSSRVE